MAGFRMYGWGFGLAIGLIIGLALGGIWPHTPIHASATDRVENYAMCTGLVDESTEAVFYLDYLTGQLTGAVVSRSGKVFQSRFTANVHRDLQSFVTASGGAAQMPQSPNYLMVTGTIKLPNTRNTTFGNTIIYVAETNTGVVMAYAIPWSAAAFSANRPYENALIPWAAQQFGGAVLRPE